MAPGLPAARKTTPAPRVAALPPSAFADTWKNRPTEITRIGIRLVSETDFEEARKNAVAEAWQTFPEDRDREPRLAAFDSTLKRELLVFATCEPDNIDAPFFKSIPNATIAIGLRDATIARLFEELEQLSASTSPLIPEATDDDLSALAALLSAPAVFDRIEDVKRSRVRRLARYLANELGDLGITAED